MLFSDEKIIDLLHQYNPWWKNGELNQGLVPEQRRFAYYEAKKILFHQDLRRFVVLSGARRVGKTTIMMQLIYDLLQNNVPAKNILYLSFDNPILKLGGIDGVLKVYENTYGMEQDVFLFFDEIQYAESWEVWIKTIYDARPNVKIIATGSASPMLAQGSADSGVGRWSVLKIPTLSFYEYCQLLNIKNMPELAADIKVTELARLNKAEISDLMNKLAGLQSHFNRYLIVGGFPELALAQDDYFAQRMLREDVVDKVIKRDVLSLFNVRNPLAMEKVFLYLCLHSANLINITTMSKELDGINKATITSYIQFLKEANLLYISQPVGLDGKGVLKGRPKIYVADAAIRNAVLMINDVLTKPEEMGIMVETTVYKHILAYYGRMPASIGYYRRVNDEQKEIDIVVDLPLGKILCEVKYRNNSVIKANDAIIEVANSQAKKVQAALVTTKQPNDYGIVAHKTNVPVMRIPTAAFLYILGHMEKMEIRASNIKNL